MSRRLLINCFTRDLRNWNPERGDSNSGSGKTEIKVVSRVSGRDKKISNLNLRTNLQFKMHKEWGLKLKELGPFCPLPPPLHTRSAVSHGCNLDPNLCARTQRLRDKPTSSRSKVHEQSPRPKSREMSGGAGTKNAHFAEAFCSYCQRRKPVFRLTKLT